jgi:CheY-like chemotaxis protein
LKILIAEDEKFNYLLLKEIFKGMNATIIWTVNGMEAVNVCKTTPDIDLVLMDMKMPVMDGFEATIQLKKLFPDLPVIAQSAYASEKDRIKILECGCDDLITKPFDVKLLKSTFNKYFESKKISDKAGIH